MKFIKEKSFYKNLILIMVPIALQNLITFALTMADTLMLGQADETGSLLSASSLANQPFFILQLFVFGLSGAGAVLSAQYWGKKNTEAIRNVISIVVKASFLVALIAGALVLLFPREVMSIYSNKEAVIENGIKYISVMGWAYPIFAISSSFICSLRSVELVKISVIVNLCSFGINVFLNWVLIFGNLGFPALGITGAAIATFTARCVELVVVLIYVLCIDKRLRFRVRDFFRFNKQLTLDLLKHGTPVVINEVMWSLGISIQAAILGHINYVAGDPVAANSIVGTVQQLATTVIFGIGNAAAVMIGKSIGENEGEVTLVKARTLKYLSFVLGILACVIILLTKDLAIGFFSINEETKMLANDMMIVIAFVTIFVSSSSVYIMGILRGAGDTRFCLFAEMAALWCIATPLAAICGLWLQLPIPVVLIAMKIDEPVKTLFCTIRMHGTRWVKSVARDTPAKTPTELPPAA